MKSCCYLKGCAFFSKINTMDDDVAGFFKETFCLVENSECARRKVAETVGRDYVPESLYPNELNRAEEIISKHSKI